MTYKGDCADSNTTRASPFAISRVPIEHRESLSQEVRAALRGDRSTQDSRPRPAVRIKSWPPTSHLQKSYPARQCDGSRDGLEPKFVYLPSFEGRRTVVAGIVSRTTRRFVDELLTILQRPQVVIAYGTHRSIKRRIANGTSSGYVAHHAIIRSSLSESSKIALISTSSASTVSGSLI